MAKIETKVCPMVMPGIEHRNDWQGGVAALHTIAYLAIAGQLEAMSPDGGDRFFATLRKETIDTWKGEAEGLSPESPEARANRYGVACLENLFLSIEERSLG